MKIKINDLALVKIAGLTLRAKFDRQTGTKVIGYTVYDKKYLGNGIWIPTFVKDIYINK